jgi:molecular chaperone HscB
MNLADDDFSLFGLPARHALDRNELDLRWRALQAQAHPDRFAAEGAAAQRLAIQWAVRINEGYRRLKDPIARGAYLCGLRGVEIGAQTNTAMPGDFLVQQMSWREALDEAADAAAIESLETEVAAQRRELLSRLQAELDVAGDPQAAAATVRALMFVERFGADIERRLEALET